MIKRLQGKAFSILIDEWSDIDVKPHLGIVVMYHCDQQNRFVTQFLTLTELEKTNSDSIFAAIVRVFDDFNLKFENLIGYGSDGAAAVSGKNSSVWTKIKERAPNTIQFTCICHSLHLVAEHAFNELPSRIGALLKMIPKWFSKSFV